MLEVAETGMMVAADNKAPIRAANGARSAKQALFGKSFSPLSSDRINRPHPVSEQ